MRRILFTLFFTSLLSGAAFADSDRVTHIQPYGFIWAEGVVATRSFSSFGQPNLSAPTAVYPNLSSVGSTEPTVARDSFQFSQTRFGVNLKANEQFGGQVEMDFIDFAKATPVTSAVPRLRIAKMYYKLDTQNEVSIGQDWDVFSPGKPFTFNPVSLYFEAGNTGFIRPQIAFKHKGDTWSYETSLGISAKNPGNADANVEKGMFPTWSGALSYFLSKDSKVGASFVLGRLRFATAGEPVWRGAYGVDVFFEGKVTEGIELHAAGYYGESLNSMYSLTLATATAAESRHEAGGYVTARTHLSSEVKAIVGAGAAHVFEANGSIGDNLADNRVRDNVKLSFAVSYSPLPALDVFIQDTQFGTHYLQVSAQNDNWQSGNLVELGAMYSF